MITINGEMTNNDHQMAANLSFQIEKNLIWHESIKKENALQKLRLDVPKIAK